MPELQVYRRDAVADPGGRQVAAYMTAVGERERWVEIRLWMAELVAAAGVPCWVMAAWPHLLPATWRPYALGLFACFATVLVWAVVQERLWHARVCRTLPR